MEEDSSTARLLQGEELQKEEKDESKEKIMERETAAAPSTGMAALVAG